MRKIWEEYCQAKKFNMKLCILVVVGVIIVIVIMVFLTTNIWTEVMKVDQAQIPADDERQALKAVVNLVRLTEPLIFELWRSHDLTLAQVQCLRILSHQAEQAGDLARKLSMSSTSLTRILERLESRGMVERTTDLHDRRRVWVQLTDTGRTTVSSLTSWYTSSIFQAIRHMDPVERDSFTDTLTRFIQSVHDLESSEIVGNASTSLSEEIQWEG